jgi:magnesium chelatase family protein
MEKVFSVALYGFETKTIEVEVEVSKGLRNFQIVGLPDKAVQESIQRVCSALKNSGFTPPDKLPRRVLVSLAPADLKKEGSLYDLPIALGYLLASGEIKFDFEKTLIFGELALDGKVRPVRGVLAFCLHAKKENFQKVILPKENENEAMLVEGIEAIGVESLKDCILYFLGQKKIEKKKFDLKDFFEDEKYEIDLDTISGQEIAKRALEICAAGGHHLFLLGPPGIGKSLLAKSLVSILPPLSFEEAVEVTKIYSIAGILPKEKPLILKRPFRSPHHTISETALIGGGNPPRIGEITLAHRGVLFLDEFPEFHRDILESLREPLEEGEIKISRAKYSFYFPCQFILVAASNPCPCGYFGDPEIPCSCTFSQVQSYQRKIKGPLIDRIDLFVNVPRIKFEKLEEKTNENLTKKVKERVKKAREIQNLRFKNEGILTNSQMKIEHIKKYCDIDGKSKELLKKCVDCGELTIRGYHKILKVARTIADLEGKEKISFENVAEALSFRKREI